MSLGKPYLCAEHKSRRTKEGLPPLFF
jgi:hypothetical protein